MLHQVLVLLLSPRHWRLSSKTVALPLLAALLVPALLPVAILLRGAAGRGVRSCIADRKVSATEAVDERGPGLTTPSTGLAVPAWLRAVPTWLRAVPTWLWAVAASLLVAWPLCAEAALLRAVPAWLRAVAASLLVSWPLCAEAAWLRAVPAWLRTKAALLRVAWSLCSKSTPRSTRPLVAWLLRAVAATLLVAWLLLPVAAWRFERLAATHLRRGCR